MSPETLVVIAWIAALTTCSIAFGAACMRIYCAIYLTDTRINIRRYSVLGLLMLLGMISSIFRLLQML
ncbi:MAG: hypothetical protein D6790_20285 [Caldilineae bacterium]|nr:MAG: hypothetical protein D6790_20285 [Caldilineae bacterium]